MNDRIRALMDQAVSFRLDPDSMGYEAQVSPEDLAAFAELMVRECMNAVCDPRTIYLESMTESSAMYAARERIRKHFGVER
jgi:hypothetical protein